MGYRIGFSKDIHRLVKKRKLILGGVIIPYSKGELAHSDGDVIYHALGESILGALALGDLGKHFPDSDPSLSNIDSSLIVKEIVKMMKKVGYKVNNVDIFVSLEEPKLKSYIEQMRNNVATVLETDINNVSIKAGTNEKMGPVGKKEAIEAYSTILLESDK